MTSPAAEKLLRRPVSGKARMESAGLGVPDRIRRVTWMDLGAVVVVFLAFMIASSTVLCKPAAVFWGQTNQLILLGLMLSIMGSCAQRQIQKLSLVYEAAADRSTLQIFDATSHGLFFDISKHTTKDRATSSLRFAVGS